MLISKRSFSVVFFSLFFVLLQSCGFHVLQVRDFQDHPYGESTDGRPYLELNSGEKIYGADITWKSGPLTSNSIKIGGQKFKISDTRGYFNGRFFYGRKGVKYIPRLVHGKINVYKELRSWTERDQHTGFEHTHIVALYYVQQGDGGPLVHLKWYARIKKVVADCPMAYGMVYMSDHKIKKAIRGDRDYLNKVFEIYDNGCIAIDSTQ